MHLSQLIQTLHKHRLLKLLSKRLFLHRSCLGCEGEYQLCNRLSKSAFVTALLNTANTLLLSWMRIFLKTQQLATSMWMQHSQNICLQLDFQSSSGELGTVENVIHCFHGKNLHPLFISLLAISQSCSSHFLPPNSPQILKDIVSMVSVSIVTKLLPCVTSFSCDWRQSRDKTKEIGIKIKNRLDKQAPKMVQVGLTRLRQGSKLNRYF